MKIKSLIIYLPLIFLFACSESTNSIKKHSHKTEKDSLPEPNLVYQIEREKIFIVKDSSKYSSEFLNQLRQLSTGFDTITLINDRIIVKSRPFNGNSYIATVDTTIIPMIPPLYKQLLFTKVEGDENYSLLIERISYSDIRYDLNINDSILKSGQLSLSAGIILGEETDEDDDGNAVSVIEYIANSKCMTSIRIYAVSQEYLSFNVTCWDDSKESFNIQRLKKK